MAKMNNCIICNGIEKTEDVVKGYITEKAGASIDCDIPVSVCNHCGFVKQINLPFSTEDEFDKFYSEKYLPINKEYDCRDYKGDLASEKKVFNNLKLSGSKSVLDIGCGTGALVDICRKAGIDAYGCELVKYHYAPENPYIYFRKFESIHFPTDKFEKIVCCDVVEHVLDPIKFLKEIYRVLSPSGRCYIELPLFYHEDGKGHWKRVEHIWYFKPEQFETILKRCGFKDIKYIDKEPTKIVFSITKPEQNRIKILLPPGVGDVYWPLVKLQSFLKNKGIVPPVDVAVAVPRAKKFDSHERAFPFLEMFPFLHSTNEALFNKRDPIWKEAYLEEGRSIFDDVLGCDYFLTWNGYLRAGKTLEEVNPEYECNWDLPRFVSLNEENYRLNSIKKYGKYLVIYWVFAGTGALILRQFSVDKIAACINEIVKKTGLTPILVGAIWDNEDIELQKLRKLLPKNTIDLRAKTSLEEVFGLMRGAKAVIGANSGITIMSAVFGVKTIILYSDYFYTNSVHRDFAWNTFPPSTRGKTYFAEFADRTNSADFISRAVSVINDTKYEKVEYTPQIVKKENAKIIPQKSICETIRSFDESASRMYNGEITIACVLKSGGIYTEQYVTNMKKMLNRHVTVKYDFKVLTDIIDGEDSIKLEFNLERWWSKLELFKLKGPVLYLDLDTVIMRNIDRLVMATADIREDEFIMLNPFNTRRRELGMWASGVMAFNGDFEFLLKDISNDELNGGDQDYISAALKSKSVKIEAAQKFARIASFKKHCLTKDDPKVDIVCFHGKPRVSDVKHKWILENWK